MTMSPEQWSEAIRAAGAAYSINPEFLAAINKYEQSGTSNFVVNDWDSNAAKGTPSGGPFQFIKPTFSAFARQAREANPEAWRGVQMDWKNPVAQALAASWAFSAGKGSHWATYRKALGSAGGKMRGGSGGDLAALVRAGGSTGASGGTSDRKAAALSLIFDGDPMFALAAQSNAGSVPRSETRNSGPSVQTGAGVPARRKGEKGYQYLQRIGQTMFGLRNDPGNSQTFGGSHRAGSHHYDGRAIDWGNARNTAEQIRAWDQFIANNKGALGIAEHVPMGSQSDHMDHSHTSTARKLKGMKK